MQFNAQRIYKFDSFLPIYNWLYPLSGRRAHRPDNPSRNSSLELIAHAELKSRALYVHVPFCETICSFCPFVRGEYRDSSLIEAYTKAIISEITRKGAILNRHRQVSVRSIFVGGGTPSILKPEQARNIIEALKNNFDVSQLEEFSFEFEVKSITEELAETLRDCGVTHARFGLQTFDTNYRNLFSLTSTVEQIERAATMLPKYFRYVSCDLLYGMNGQTDVQFVSDIKRVTDLGLNNIDFYPINNVVTQKKLHAAFRKQNLAPISGMTKFYMNAALRQIMLSRGFLPHNGHGYVRCDAGELRLNPVVTKKYSFVYHEHVYGYNGCDVIGFGVNAISSTQGFVLCNEPSREKYIRDINNKGQFVFTVFEHSKEIDAARPICLHLPYHGEVDLMDTEWSLVPDDIKTKIDALLESDLLTANGTRLALTLDGWHWYTNIMYWLLPKLERMAVDTMIKQTLKTPGRTIEETSVPMTAELPT